MFFFLNWVTKTYRMRSIKTNLPSGMCVIWSFAPCLSVAFGWKQIARGINSNCPVHSRAFPVCLQITTSCHVSRRPLAGSTVGPGVAASWIFIIFLKFIDIFSPGKQESQRGGKIYSSSHGQFTWYVRFTVEHHESMIFTPLQLKSVPIQRLMVST